jgi:hypothetical protein
MPLTGHLCTLYWKGGTNWPPALVPFGEDMVVSAALSA